MWNNYIHSRASESLPETYNKSLAEPCEEVYSVCLLTQLLLYLAES